MTLDAVLYADGNTGAITIEMDASAKAEGERFGLGQGRTASGRRKAAGQDAIVDIAVSRIGATGSNYAEYGVFDGIAAFSSATTSCNVGTAEAEWIAGSSGRHPVIAQNLYRLSGDTVGRPCFRSIAPHTPS